MKNDIKNIGIIGLGLIGGSIAKAFKQENYHIIGITKSKETIAQALKENIIDNGYISLDPSYFKELDVIFLAVPLSLIKDYLKKLSELITHKIIVTDVGSTKDEICKFANKILPSNISFVGGHPMAGSENIGFKASSGDLFKNAAWIFTVSKKTDNQTLKILQKLVKHIGAIPITISPQKHDLAVALISHLPLLISFGLCNLIKNCEDEELGNLAQVLASSGFRDVTRIASGNSKLSNDLIVSNINNIEKLIPLYVKEFQELMLLGKSNPKALVEILQGISNWRNKIYNSKGKNKLLIEKLESQ